MNICSWNVRGLNDPNKALEVRRVTQKHEIKIFALLETRVKKKNV